MGAKTKIEWTAQRDADGNVISEGATWNPWMGCTKVSPGCAHCYMFREQRQYGRDPEVVVRSKTKFRDPLRWKEPKTVFTCSWSDWFHKTADQWRDEAWAIVRDTPQHTYQILTKRPERIAEHLPGDWGEGYPNVWLGVSVENQRWTRRAWTLAKTIPAAVRFISAEPLLGPVDLRLVRIDEDTTVNVLPAFQWVIAGGESGPGYRQTREAWIRSLRDQCQEYGVAFFLKQLGGWPDKRGGEKAVLDGQRWTQMPDSKVAA